jgi:hypothetical protein
MNGGRVAWSTEPPLSDLLAEIIRHRRGTALGFSGEFLRVAATGSSGLPHRRPGGSHDDRFDTLPESQRHHSRVWHAGERLTI